jgi:hypothetical protein
LTFAVSSGGFREGDFLGYFRVFRCRGSPWTRYRKYGYLSHQKNVWTNIRPFSNEESFRTLPGNPDKLLRDPYGEEETTGAFLQDPHEVEDKDSREEEETPEEFMQNP